ncbi:gfo/Idh/MocA family oxidoreductase [Brevibacillus laterosporus]|uniref:Gfo/Idh/MocA family oxidoreductase n=1 Tax=Brevibacillus laterosporus TaxID=1465 RepID=A0A502H9B3_BRELA|nr:Gfo/Idh/MocA family oxidoreductase [Brevibacillus laterosporus]QDX92883.1 gfo/Idh/MocA family oxidoreductase [Brevibacillus laterosporus]TPG71237.1 gfo/Idh/MocA family oxidoreductase [Brevibacillus laterosporus]TPG78088.1 gfo/Idh/MocA family oxidoreductase [Brevibacillus laterosporus]
MLQPRIGVIGLGSIAQKAYLPLVAIEKNWKLIGAYSPTATKREEICKHYRMNSYSDMNTLIQACDAVFVHSSTSTHFEIVQHALKSGVDVFVDKPLAETVEQAEILAELSEKHNRKLMVGFNRRFAPLYIEAKAKMGTTAWIRFEKHRKHGVHAGHSAAFTLLDDYLHLIDTARWLGASSIRNGTIALTEKGQLLHAQHQLGAGTYSITTAMHRQSGSNKEQLEIVSIDGITRIQNLEMMEVESEGYTQQVMSHPWDSILKRRGFEGAVQHFMDCLNGDQKPLVDGWEGVESQRLVTNMIKEMNG